MPACAGMTKVYPSELNGLTTKGLRKSKDGTTSKAEMCTKPDRFPYGGEITMSDEQKRRVWAQLRMRGAWRSACGRLRSC